jgi:ABC-2 type transport system ATP-binding protein
VPSAVLETRDLTKRFDDLFALRDFTVSLAEGDVYGFIGPNGAGKTTTMRILATLLAPTWGEASIGGYSIYTHAKQVRRLIGYLPDFFGVYDDMTVGEYLEFFAAAYRIRGAARRQRCEELLELVELGFKRDALASTLSRGQTQRLGLARVLLHDPSVLLLDEPASGLDPRARIEMRALLRRLRGLGKTILVSSHILPELADVCNKIGIIDRGRLVASGSVADVMRQVRSQVVLEIGVAADSEGAARRLADHPSVTAATLEDGKLVVALADGASDYSDLATMLVQAGYKLTLLREQELNLETAFMRLTRAMGDEP